MRFSTLVPVWTLMKTESEEFSGRVAYIWQTLSSLQIFYICNDLEN